MRHSLLLSLTGLLFACFVYNTDGLAVMSIDLGNEFMKIAIVKPGVPMEIVLNKESRRKSPTVVAMRNGERTFGDEALTTAVKYPKNAYRYLRELLGKSANNPVVKKFKETFPYYNIVDDEERKTFVFQHDENTRYSPEELLAMILQYAKIQAENFAEQPIPNAVIVVPSYFNQAERRALKRAAELAGINVLQLMNDNAAVALNYGVFRRKAFNTTATNIMFYDMGSTSTSATIVAYQLVKTKEHGFAETNPQLAIKGVGFDKTMGSFEVQLRLQRHLARVFNEQKKSTKDVFQEPRAMAKLFKEAGRVKNVLSANTEHFAQIEGLLDEIDFRAKVTREELETMCEDIFSRVGNPVAEALKAAHMTMDEVSEVILMGAGTRAPIVQERLKKAIGREELGKSINTDEAAALGGVYQAAHLSTGFRVLKFHVKDANMYPIQVDFERQKVDDQGAAVTKPVSRVLFGRNNPYPQKKVMTFNRHLTDFSFRVNYGDLSFLSQTDVKSFGSLNLTTVSLTGVAEAHNKHSPTTEAKGIKAHFRMDESGMLQLDLVESVFEKAPAPEDEKEEKSTLTKLGDTISNFFSGSSDAKGGNKDEASKDEASKDEASKDGEKSDTSESTADKGESTGDKAEPPSDKPEETPSEKLQSESGGDKSEGDKSKTESKKEEVDAEKSQNKTEPEKPTGNATEFNTTATNTTTEKKPPKPVLIKEEIKSEVSLKDLQDPSEDIVKASVKLLKKMKKRDEEKIELEKAKNSLEAFIFDTQSKLYEDDFETCSTEEEREKIGEQLTAASDWQYEQDDSAGPEPYQQKLKELKTATGDLFQRVHELEERPKVLEQLKQMLNYSSHFYRNMANFTGEDQPFTQVEMETLGKLVNDTKSWKKKMEKEQKALPLTQKPVLLVQAVVDKMRELDREVNYLLNKAKTFRPKPKPKAENATDEVKTSVNGTETTPLNETKTASNETKSGDEGVRIEEFNVPPPPTEEKGESSKKSSKEPAEEEETVLELGSDQEATESTTVDPTTTHNEEL